MKSELGKVYDHQFGIFREIFCLFSYFYLYSRQVRLLQSLLSLCCFCGLQSNVIIKLISERVLKHPSPSVANGIIVELFSIEAQVVLPALEVMSGSVQGSSPLCSVSLVPKVPTH